MNSVNEETAQLKHKNIIEETTRMLETVSVKEKISATENFHVAKVPSGDNYSETSDESSPRLARRLPSDVPREIAEFFENGPQLLANGKLVVPLFYLPIRTKESPAFKVHEIPQ